MIPFLFLSTGCEEEEPADTSGYNCTPNGCFADAENAQYLTIEDCESYCNPDDYDEDGDGDGDSANWSFSVSLNGNTYASAGSLNCNTTSLEIMSNSENFGYADYNNGVLSVHLAIRDITDEDTYISGNYIGLTITFNSPFIGDNTASLAHWVGMSGMGGLFGSNDIFDYLSGFPFTCSDTIIMSQTAVPYQGCEIEAWNISSLGGECGSGNVIGSYSGTLYAQDSPGATYSTYETPVEFEVSFNVPRL